MGLFANIKWQWWYAKVHFNMVAQLRITDEAAKRALFDGMTADPCLMAQLKLAFASKLPPEEVASILIDSV